MASSARITVPLSPEFIERLRVLSIANDISHAKLISCLLSLDDAEIKRIVKEKSEELFVSKAHLEERRRLAKKALTKLSPEEIERILALAETQNDDN